jgi:hypothetical protein
MAQPQRQPIPYQRGTIEVVEPEAREDRVIHLSEQVKELQNLSTIPIGSSLRRLVFVWLRIYVNERKRGKSEKVNIKIPLPIPLLGAAFSRQLTFQRAAKMAAQARRGEDVSDMLDSAMGFEFIRVEDDHSERDKSTLVVIGLD